MTTGPIKSCASLKAHLDSLNGLPIRRWYVSRLYGPGDDESRLGADLFYAPADDALAEDLGLSLRGASFDEFVAAMAAQDTEALDWWGDEDFDHRVHITVAEFRECFALAEGHVEEGMVFVEFCDGSQRRLVPFTYQARRTSKRVVAQLLTPRSGADEEAV